MIFQRKSSRAGLACLILSIAVTCDRVSAPCAVEDTPENRSAQVDRYFEAMPPENLWKGMVDNMATRMPDEQRARFVEMVTKQFDAAKLRSIMHDGMEKHFTADEIRAMADFYGSELGKSATAKFGTYMADVMPAVQSEVVAAVRKASSEAEAAEKEKSPAEPPKP